MNSKFCHSTISSRIVWKLIDKALKMKLVVALLACVLLLEGTDARFLKGNSEGVPFICSSKSPCGWEVYKPYFRTIEYFMKSPCECPSGTVCVRSSDDISISAYVHRCSPLEEENE